MSVKRLRAVFFFCTIRYLFSELSIANHVHTRNDNEHTSEDVRKQQWRKFFFVLMFHTTPSDTRSLAIPECVIGVSVCNLMVGSISRSSNLHTWCGTVKNTLGCRRSQPCSRRDYRRRQCCGIIYHHKFQFPSGTKTGQSIQSVL